MEGLLTALVYIDEVIWSICSSENSAQAKQRLIERFSLSDVQTQYILDTPLRWSTRFDRIELESEKDLVNVQIEELTRILDSERGAAQAGAPAELGGGCEEVGLTALRRCWVVPGGAPVAAVPLQVADDPAPGTAGRRRPAGPHRERRAPRHGGGRQRSSTT
ncbi:DNA topoisomerase (ATP-hydrolyzing) OS=Streptomyces tendae OX=1932 GN=GUR47_34900 PE=3 SV=1 [Streptomyces tendae]